MLRGAFSAGAGRAGPPAWVTGRPVLVQLRALLERTRSSVVNGLGGRSRKKGALVQRRSCSHRFAALCTPPPSRRSERNRSFRSEGSKGQNRKERCSKCSSGLNDPARPTADRTVSTPSDSRPFLRPAKPRIFKLLPNWFCIYIYIYIYIYMQNQGRIWDASFAFICHRLPVWILPTLPKSSSFKSARFFVL